MDIDEELLTLIISIGIIIIIPIIMSIYSFLTARNHNVMLNSPEQLYRLKSFLHKYRLKSKVLSNDFRYETNRFTYNKTCVIRIDHSLAEIIESVYYYGRAKRFFKDYNTIENSYFKAEYMKHYIDITNIHLNMKIRISKNCNKIWLEIAKNISEDLLADELIEILKNNNLINKITSRKLKNKNYVSQKENIEIKKRNKYQNKKKQRSAKRRILDVNNCTLEQLSSLPGITIIVAKRLIKYREENGGFCSVNNFWEIANLNPNIKYQIEKKKIIKTKKIKNAILRIIETTITKTFERVVDL